jgi:hypothetical protein
VKRRQAIDFPAIAAKGTPLAAGRIASDPGYASALVWIAFMADARNAGGPPSVGRAMMEEKRTVYTDASEVDAVEGAVEMDGPDNVNIAMTPEAAEETSERLTDQAVKARGQRRLGRMIHRAR